MYGHLFTSAGATAGIDLALALVEAELGRPLVVVVARRLQGFIDWLGVQLAPHLDLAQKMPLTLDSKGVNATQSGASSASATVVCVRTKAMKRASAGGTSPARQTMPVSHTGTLRRGAAVGVR